MFQPVPVTVTITITTGTNTAVTILILVMMVVIMVTETVLFMLMVATPMMKAVTDAAVGVQGLLCLGVLPSPLTSMAPSLSCSTACAQFSQEEAAGAG